MSSLLPFVVIGLANGAVYGLAGTGLVLTYKTSGIFNFAHGAVAAGAAYVFFELWQVRGVPWPVATVLCLVVLAPAAGLLLERIARGLASASTAMKIVGTVGLLLAVQGGATAIYGPEARYFPPFLPTGTVSVFGVRVGVDQLVVAAIAAAASLGLAAFFRVARLGAAMRAVVDDPALLDLTGTSPTKVRRLAWVIGSVFATLSGLLIAPTIGLDAVLLTFLVVQAFGAAAIGRFSNLTHTFLGGLAIGVVASVATRQVGSVAWLAGLPASLPFLVLFVMLLVSRRLPEGAERSAARPARPVPRRVPPAVVAAAVAVGAAVPWLVGARLPVFTNAAAFVVLFASMVLLINLSGQVSLCHAAFAAVGATTFSHLTVGAGMPWVLAALGAGLAAAVLGALVAIPAIRLSGLSLALATFGLGVLLERMVFGTAVMFGDSGTRTTPRPALLGLESDRGFYLLAVAAAIGAIALVVVLARGRLGRLLAGLADAPTALATLGATVTVTRVLVFCISAFLAGVAGVLMGGLNGSVSAVAFGPVQSLVWLAVLATGGRAIARTSVVAALALAALPAYLSGFADYQAVLFGLVALGAALGSTHSGMSLTARERLGDYTAWRAAGGERVRRWRGRAEVAA